MKATAGFSGTTPFALGYDLEWFYPSSDESQTQDGATLETGKRTRIHARHGADAIGSALGTPHFRNDPRYGLVLHLGETNADIAENNGFRFRHASGPMPFGQLLSPAAFTIPASERVRWWRVVMRYVSGVPNMRDGVGLVPGSIATEQWWSTDAEAATGGAGIILSGDGAGGMRLRTKALVAGGLPVNETIAVTWPGALTDWTEVWFVLLPGTKSRAGIVRLYVNQALAVQRSWPADGITGSTLPSFNHPVAGVGAGLRFDMRCNGPGAGAPRMEVLPPIIYRQGRYDVNGIELSGL